MIILFTMSTFYKILGKTVILVGLLFGVVLLSGLTFDNAFAAIDMFLKIDGIEGESTDEAHRGEIDVLQWSWGLSQSSPSHGGGQGSSKVNIQEMSITKSTDTTTSDLMQSCCTGNSIGDVTLEICSSVGAKICYFKMEMESVLISSMSIGGNHEEEVLSETITLNFDKVEFTYIPHDLDTGMQTGEELKWNIEEGKKA